MSDNFVALLRAINFILLSPAKKKAAENEKNHCWRHFLLLREEKKLLVCSCTTLSAFVYINCLAEMNRKSNIRCHNNEQLKRRMVAKPLVGSTFSGRKSINLAISKLCGAPKLPSKGNWRELLNILHHASLITLNLHSLRVRDRKNGNFCALLHPPVPSNGTIKTRIHWSFSRVLMKFSQSRSGSDVFLCKRRSDFSLARASPHPEKTLLQRAGNEVKT